MTHVRRAWLTAGLAGVLMTMLGVYIWLGASVATVSAVRTQFRLPQIGNERPELPAVSAMMIDRALMAAPLKQSIYNAHLVVEAAKMPGLDLRAPLAVLRRLGWRDPTSVQNMISNALVTTDLADIAEAGDALLRQDVLIDEATGLMVLLEAFPETWPSVAKKLAQDVPWRYRYLEKGGLLSTPEQLDGRLRTLSMLQARGDLLKRQELAPFVTLMTDQGRVLEARRLWIAHTGEKADLLLDPMFTGALKQSLLGLPTTPFEWNFQGGVGYVADITTDGMQGARGSIQWDGRSVPLFLTQRTGAKPGRYQLNVKVEGEPIEFSRRIGFRLRCDAGAVPFDREAIGPGNMLVLTMSNNVACAFPILDVFGKVQEPRRAVDVAFSSVQMKRVD